MPSAAKSGLTLLGWMKRISDPEILQAVDKVAHSATAGNRTLFAMLMITPCLLTLAYGANDSASLLLVALLTSVFSLIWLVRAFRKGFVEFYFSPLYLPIVGIMMLCIVQLLPLSGLALDPSLVSVKPSAALSFDPYSTRIFLYRLFALSIFFAGALTFTDTTRRVQILTMALTIFGGVIAFGAIIQRLASPDAIYGVSRTPNAIPFGPYVNQHHFAALMVLLSGPAISEILVRRRLETRLLYLIAAVLMAVAVLLTGSRGGVLAYLTMLAAVGLATVRFREKRIVPDKVLVPLSIGLLGMALIIGLAIFLGGDGAISRGFGLNYGEGDFTSGRRYFWAIAWQVFTAHPILGAGMDAFGVAFTQFDTRNGFYRVEQAHNDYLQMLSDGGIVGFLITVGFLFLFFRESLRRIKESTGERLILRHIRIGSFAGCCGVLVHSFFDFPLRTWSNSYFFLLLVAIATRKIADNFTSSQNSSS